jgi:hypothetical protein
MADPAPAIEEVYDPQTVARLDAWARREASRVEDAPLAVRERATASVFVAAIGLGLQEVLEPRKATPVIEEVDADPVEAGEPVRLLWTGEPRSTVALVDRAWYLAVTARS